MKGKETDIAAYHTGEEEGAICEKCLVEQVRQHPNYFRGEGQSTELILYIQTTP